MLLRSFSSDDLEGASAFSGSTNFVLIGRPQDGAVKIFGDILPQHAASNTASNVIVTSWEGLVNFIVQSQTFVICVLSLFKQVANSVAYQTYLAAASSIDQVQALPQRYSKLKDRIVELVQTIHQPQTRSMLWLELKIDARALLNQLIESMETLWRVTKKFYLASIVGITLSVLSVGGIAQSSSSFLSGFLQNNSVIEETVVLGASDQMDFQYPGESSTLEIQNVFKHTVQSGEDVDGLAAIYGLDKETVLFNNNLNAEDTINTGDVLYLPWTKGYIYNTVEETKAEDLSRIYNVSAEDILTENTYVVNDSGSFDKDTLVLIPTDDFTKVVEANEAESKRKDDIKEAAAAAEARKAALARKAVTSNTTTSAAAAQPSRTGFIWPAKGFISRCVTGSHIACDIANASRPPLYAVQNGTVSAVYRYTVVGYGLAVVIDHGNGLKTLYAHMDRIDVSAGQTVRQGQILGQMGCTGRCTGPHVHFEVVKNGVRQNPLNYLPS